MKEERAWRRPTHLLNAASASCSSLDRTTIRTLFSSLAFLNAASYPPTKNRGSIAPSVSPCLARRDNPDEEPTWTPEAEEEAVDEREGQDSPVRVSTERIHASEAAVGERMDLGWEREVKGLRGRKEAVEGRRRKRRAVRREKTVSRRGSKEEKRRGRTEKTKKNRSEVVQQTCGPCEDGDGYSKSLCDNKGK